MLHKQKLLLPRCLLEMSSWNYADHHSITCMTQIKMLRTKLTVYQPGPQNEYAKNSLGGVKIISIHLDRET